MNVYLIVLIFLFIVYCVKTQLKTEGFAQWSVEERGSFDEKYFSTMTSYNEIYDDFFAFYYDELVGEHTVYQTEAALISTHFGNVYNNVLNIGIKHGGEMHKYINRDSSPHVKSVSLSKSVIKRCKYNNPNYEGEYEHVTDLQYPFLFDPHSFTHISLLENEIYYCENIRELLYNISEWITHKGYLFIELFKNENNMIEEFKDKRSEISQFTYSSTITKTTQNSFTLVDTIKPKYKHQTRKNIHNLYFYSNEYIEYICKELGLFIIDKTNISDHKMMFIFQKVQ